MENLKSLHPASLDAAAEYVENLKRAENEDRTIALDRSFGALSHEEAEEMTQAIERTCERIDANQW